MTDDIRQLDPGSEALTDALNVSFRVLRYVMVLLLIAYALSGFFIVKPDEQALVLVFGKISGVGNDRVKGPGFHWTWPRPLAAIERVPTERVQAVETRTFWYETGDPTQPPPPAQPTLRPGQDGYLITGDTNLMHSRWTLRYRIDDPVVYVSQFGDLEGILVRELDHAVVKTTGRFPIDRALRTDIESYRGAVAEELTRRVEALGLGVRIAGVEMTAKEPPRQVDVAFEDVGRAENERSQKMSTARGAAAKTRNDAEGQAKRLVAEGRAYQQRLVSEVAAEAAYFDVVHREYVKNPTVIARTLLAETLRRVLTAAEDKYILHEGGKQELRLQLGPVKKSPFQKE